jgi:predicted phosphatase
MSEIKDLFHKVGNCHNKISVCAGLTKMELEDIVKTNKLPAEIEKIMERLTYLEQHAIEASKVLDRLEDYVYSVIDPDTEKARG